MWTEPVDGRVRRTMQKPKKKPKKTLKSAVKTVLWKMPPAQKKKNKTKKWHFPFYFFFFIKGLKEQLRFTHVRS